MFLARRAGAEFPWSPKYCMGSALDQFCCAELMRQDTQPSGIGQRPLCFLRRFGLYAAGKNETQER